ncbi:MAG: xanthine dehydrogenase accessory protein XdhC [Rhodobacteraceae bacterium]|nr:xanthine dehydrogenase accessory protein XdhC [Paracoccaceae bacterium]
MYDLDALTAAVAAHGRVARVVIAAHDGSSPREVGAAMLVWAGGQSGTIGGGALEWQAAAAARAILVQGCGARLSRVPLGPALGQCCGGAVTLLTEVHDADHLPMAEAGVVARAVDGRDMPLAVKRLLDRARGQGILPAAQLVQGWFVEPALTPQRDLWVWGAGHVGRALVGVLAPLPGLRITWVDVAVERFPAMVSEAVTALPCADAAALVTHAPKAAEHLIVTYSHALDLDLCHRLLAHGFGRAGLIGSATKWARFRSRLAALGHAPDAIARIACPIGDPRLGKHPQAIAIGVAAVLLRHERGVARKETAR